VVAAQRLRLRRVRLTVWRVRLASIPVAPAIIAGGSGGGGGGGGGGGSGGGTFQTGPAQFQPATSAFQGLTTFGMAERIAARGADAPVNIVVNGGISTSAEIGQAVYNSLLQYKQVYGPLRGFE
jgi:hypothetical protein